jgi:hypothetical protein
MQKEVLQTLLSQGTSEIGSGAEGVHEAIDDIVKAMRVMMGTYVARKRPGIQRSKPG